MTTSIHKINTFEGTTLYFLIFPGTATPYALEAAEARGTLLIGPGTEVYTGMIVGQNNRQEDLEINVCKAKQLTNMRSKSSDGAVQLTPFTNLSLEQSIDFLNDDELHEDIAFSTTVTKYLAGTGLVNVGAQE